jgi:hypothetical protein
MFAGCETRADTPSDVSSHLAGRMSMRCIPVGPYLLLRTRWVPLLGRTVILFVRYVSGLPMLHPQRSQHGLLASERIAATTAISQYVDAVVRQSFPGADVEAMSTAGVSFTAWPSYTSRASSMRPPLRLCRLGCAPQSAHCSQLLTPRRRSEPLNRRRARVKPVEIGVGVE